MASRAMALDTNLKLVTLRVITRRLVSTPTSQLPHVVPFLMSSLSTDFGDATGPENQKSQSQNETVLLHKFKSQLTSLLQDKSFEARWAAAVLIKKTIEVGEHDVLQGVAPWVRGLVGILTVSSPEHCIQLGFCWEAASPFCLVLVRLSAFSFPLCFPIELAGILL